MNLKERRAHKEVKKTLQKLEKGPHPHCKNGYCKGGLKPHGRCDECDEVTCAYVIEIKPETLRRSKVYVCDRCQIPRRRWMDRRQAQLAKRRTLDDWSKLSDPIDTSSIDPDRMPEQYAGKSRTALRAFASGDAEVAVVPDSDPATLNNTISTLGLHEEIYAEQRGTETVLRRVRKGAAR